MDLPIQSDIIRAFNQEVKDYQPICQGLTLEHECGDPAVTTRNLRLLARDRAILAVIADGKRGVLVIFKTGEMYIATGYSIGKDAVGTSELAKFLVEFNDGDLTESYEEMYEELVTWPADLAGPVPIHKAPLL